MLARTEEKKIHLVFEISIILKGVNSIFEIIGGVLALLVTKSYIVSTVLSLTNEELSQDPNDAIAHYFINLSNNFSVTTQHFVALYLLSHGIVKLFLVTGLLRRKLWAYPLSVVVFSLFIIYQIYKYIYTPSIWLLILTLFDGLIIWLTLHEYHKIKRPYKK